MQPSDVLRDFSHFHDFHAFATIHSHTLPWGAWLSHTCVVGLGPTQLSITFSTYYTASDRKLGGAREQGYSWSILVIAQMNVQFSSLIKWVIWNLQNAIHDVFGSNQLVLLMVSLNFFRIPLQNWLQLCVLLSSFRSTLTPGTAGSTLTTRTTNTQQ